MNADRRVLCVSSPLVVTFRASSSFSRPHPTPLLRRDRTPDERDVLYSPHHVSRLARRGSQHSPRNPSHALQQHDGRLRVICHSPAGRRPSPQPCLPQPAGLARDPDPISVAPTSRSRVNPRSADPPTRRPRPGTVRQTYRQKRESSRGGAAFTRAADLQRRIVN